MKIKKILLLIIFILSGVSAFGFQWEALKSENFNIFFTKGNEETAKQSLAILENYRESLVKLTGNKAKMDKVNVVIEEIGMDANGFSNPDANTIHIFTYKPTGFGDENWLETVLVHEYIHHLQMTNIGGIPKLVYNIFGNYMPVLEIIPTRPNIVVPLWMKEGITVYGESNKISEYSGRLNKGSFDAYMTSAAKEQKLWSILEATYSTNYPYESAYVYGAKFTEYLSDKYGEDKLGEFYTDFGKSPFWFISPLFPAYGVDVSAKKIFGKELPDLWNDFQFEAYAKAKDKGYDGEKIYNLKDSFIEDIFLNENTMYISQTRVEKTGINSRYVFNEIKAKDLETGSEKVVVSEPSEIGKAKINGEYIYYLVKNEKSGYKNISTNGYGAYYILKRKSMKSGKTEELFSGNIRNFEIMDSKTILYSEDNSDKFGTILKIVKDKKVTGEYGRYNILVSDISIYSGRLFLCGKKETGLQSIYEALNPAELKSVIDTPFEEDGMRILGNNVYFNANYDEAVRTYRYNIETGEIFRETKGFYSAESIVDNKNETMYYISMDSKGQNIVKKKIESEKYTLSEIKETRAKEMTDYSSLDIKKGSYCDNLKTLFPNSRLPIIDLDKEIYGLKISGEDSIGENYYNFKTVYDLKNEKIGYGIDVQKIVVPFIFGIGASNMNDLDIEENYLYMTIGNPLYHSLQSFVKDIYLQNVFIVEDDMSNTEYKASININARKEKLKMNLYVKTPIQNEEIGSEMNRIGFYSSLAVRYYLPKSQIEFGAEYMSDEKKNAVYEETTSNSVFTYNRGYTVAFDSKEWTKLNVEYGKLLTEKNIGLWNPNVMVDGLEGVVFVEGTFDNKDFAGHYNGAAGLELKTNLNASLLTIPFGIRWAINADNEMTGTFFINQ